MSILSALPVAIVAALASAPAIHRRLQRRLQPQRLQLARDGEALLSDPDLPAQLRKRVAWALDNAFPQPTLLLLLVALRAPFAVPRSQEQARLQSLDYIRAKKSVRRAYAAFRADHRRLMQWNNPISANLMFGEVAFVWAIVEKIERMARKGRHANIRRDDMLAVVEAAPAWIGHRHA